MSLSLIDLHFLDLPEVIGVYLLRRGKEIVLIESGPASTFPALLEGLRREGVKPSEVTKVLVTHVHLDHAGAAGHLAEYGAEVWLHPKGVEHLRDPSKLWASASRLYGEAMEALWGQPRPIPESQLRACPDQTKIPLASGGWITAIETPGHAEHHVAFEIDGEIFTGDVAAVRLPGQPSLRLPTPPPEFSPFAWKASLQRLADRRPSKLHLTHFGTLSDVSDHLSMLQEDLDSLLLILGPALDRQEGQAELVQRYEDWSLERSQRRGLKEEIDLRYRAIAASEMNVQGIRRWHRLLSGGQGVSNRMREALGKSTPPSAESSTEIEGGQC